MINNKRISLIVPCRNEEGIIARFLAKVPDCVDEVVIADNGSTDKTAEIARKLGAVVVTENRRDRDGIGYGYAHQAGIAAATGDILVAMDGDDTYPVSKIAPIVRRMDRENLDFVSCSRLPLTNRKAISRTRQFGIRILNLEVRLLTGTPVSDILTGMWVMRKSAAYAIGAKEGGWDYSPEIKLEAIANPAIRFAEHHIPHFVRAKEPSKQQIWKTGFRHLMFILTKRVGELVRLSDPWRAVTDLFAWKDLVTYAE